jgi:hypothetical protein
MINCSGKFLEEATLLERVWAEKGLFDRMSAVAVSLESQRLWNEDPRYHGNYWLYYYDTRIGNKYRLGE